MAAARPAYPIARDVMTYLFDPAKAMAALEELEKGWGGNVQQRMAARYSSFAAQYGASAPRAPDEAQASKVVEGENRPTPEPAAAQTDAAPPPPEPA
jgi:penicillin-binding protein 2